MTPRHVAGRSAPAAPLATPHNANAAAPVGEDVAVPVAELEALREWHKAGGRISDCCIAPTTSKCASHAVDVLIGCIPRRPRFCPTCDSFSEPCPVSVQRLCEDPWHGPTGATP